jgi:high-affinity nickel-transport protein
VLAALIMGGIEVLGLIAQSLRPTGRFWGAVGVLNGNFGTLGFAIICVFIAR